MPSLPAMARVAVRPRMLVVLVVLLAAAAVCVRLGAWQLDRAQLRGAQAEAERAAAAEEAPAVPLEQVLMPQTSFTGDLVGRKVTVRGSFDVAGQLLVLGRAAGDRTGDLVLTPLVVADGAAAGAVLPVVRGLVDDAVGRAWSVPPDGEVLLVGYLQAGEAAGDAVTAEGTTDAISPAQLVNSWGGPIFTGYLVLASSEPPQDGLVLLPPPTASGGGLNIQNLGYALQWWIFGGFALVIWVRMVRDQAGAQAGSHQSVSPPEPTPTS